MKVLRYTIGGMVVAAGVAGIMAGGWMTAYYAPDLSQPFYLHGWALGLLGFVVLCIGLWICGADLRGD